MAAAFEWPRRSVLSSIALESWPAPTTVSIAPSLIYPSWTSERESYEDLLDILVLKAVEQKIKEDMMLVSLQETSSKSSLDQQTQQTGAWKGMKPCQVKIFIFKGFVKFSSSRVSGTLDPVSMETTAVIPTHCQQSKKGELCASTK